MMLQKLLNSQACQSMRRQFLHTIDIPHPLAEITDIDAAGEVAPRDAGLPDDAVDNIIAAIEHLYAKACHPLLSVCIRRHGKIIINRSIGYVDGVSPEGNAENPPIASVDTPICLFSASKFISAMLVHLLEEQGKINLLDPVSYYIPEFAKKGKGNITIYQLLAHRGGIPTVNEEAPIDAFFDHDLALRFVCDAEPTNREGRQVAYHAITSGILIDELIRVTTGMNAQEYLDKYIRQPLGMRYFRYGVTEADMAKLAKNFITGGPKNRIFEEVLHKALGLSVEDAIAISNERRFLSMIAPSANICATAEEASRFFQVMLNHGEWQGQQIFSPLTVLRATREVEKAKIDKTLYMPMRYSAGAMLGGSPFGLFGQNSHHAYGHIGLSNIFCWADPERDISVAILNTGKPILGPHLAAVIGLVNTISKECHPVVDMVTDTPIYQRYLPA